MSYNSFMRKKIFIPKKELISLYYNKKKSKYEIGRIYNCSFKTVLNRMREFGMEPLSRSIIQSKYAKNNFNGSDDEKAYMVGFRLGDLNVYKTTEKSEVVVVRCHSTCMDQIELIKGLFSKYGQVTCSNNIKKNSWHVNCFLDSSFSFLLPKIDKVEKWISKNKTNSIAFAAGYIDAEGNIGIYDGRARFKIDAYDKNIILWFYKWFQDNQIHCPKPTMIGKKNQIYDKVNNYKYNSDLWRIRVSDMDSLKELFIAIKPYLKHAKRISDLSNCLKNLHDRKNRTN